MHKNYLIPLLIFAIGIFGCTKRYYCGLGQYEIISTPSKVVRFVNFATGDTILGNLSGKIMTTDSSINKVFSTALIGAYIIAFDNLTSKKYGTVSDMEGDYNLFIPASRYDIKFQYTGMDVLILKDALILPGDKFILDALIGQGIDSTVFQVMSDRSLLNLHSPQLTPQDE